MDLDTFIVTTYCLVDETFDEVLAGQWLRQRGPRPIGVKSRQMGLVYLGEAPDYFALYGDEKQQISEAVSEEERYAG